MKDHIAIVVGIDFSESSPIVLRHAIRFAESRDATVVAVHVLDHSCQDFHKLSGLRDPGFELLKLQAEEKFGMLLAGEGNDANVEFLVKSGKPADELNQLAKDLEASVMIVSANDMTKARLGSVAARCVRTAPCDVLILRDWHGGDFRKIVVCTDFSETSDRAINRAAEITRQCGGELEIVNVMYPPNRDSWGEVLEHAADSPVSYAEECRDKVGQMMKSCLNRHEAELDGVRYDAVVLESQMTSVAITEHVKSSGCDLVVLGTRGHSAIASYFLGTNAERLIHDAAVSVLAVR